MKKLFLVLTLIYVLTPIAKAGVYKFTAIDEYYKTPVPIDSVNTYDVETGEYRTFVGNVVDFSISSVRETQLQDKFKIFPNPASNILNIDLTNQNNTQLNITDITGKVHFASTPAQSSKLKLDISGLSAGVYNLQCGDYSQTFIKLGESTGNIIRILNSSNAQQNTLIKENKIQADFDYRFTIYTKGYIPYILNINKAISDTNLKVNVKALPMNFSQKHIRVELFLSQTKDNYHYKDDGYPDGNRKDYSYTKIRDLTYDYYDTLSINSNRFLVENKFEDRKGSTFGIDSLEKIDFKIDVQNNEIYDIKIEKNNGQYYNIGSSNSYTTSYSSKFKFEYPQSIKYSDENGVIVAFIYLNDSKFVFQKSIYDYSSEYPGILLHLIEDKYEMGDPYNSYIKIEFLD